MRPRKSARRAGNLAGAALAAMLASCQASGDQGSAAAPVAEVADSALTGTQDTQVVNLDDPLGSFDLPENVATTTNERLVPLRLVNDGDEDALVHAAGGAEEVLLDSVPAGAHVRVDIITRALRLQLRSETRDGRLLWQGEVQAGDDSVSNVVVNTQGRD